MEDKRTLKPLILIQVLTLLSVALFLSACERDTRVSISDAKIPPAFSFSGSGEAGYFYVVAVADVDSYSPGDREIWKLSAKPYGGRSVNRVPPIRYGIVPDGWVQEKPETGPPPPLEEGKFYRVTAPSVSAGFRAMCFKVEQGNAVTVPCRER